MCIIIIFNDDTMKHPLHFSSIVFTVIVFLVMNLGSSGQTSSKDILLLVNPGSSSGQEIIKGDHIWFKTNPANPYKEAFIEKISGDTIYYKHGMVRTVQITDFKIYTWNIKKFSMLEWKFIIPPKEVYSSYEMLHAWESWAAKHIKPDGSYNYNVWMQSQEHRTGVNWSPKRVILFETRKCPTLFKITEKQNRKVSAEGMTGSRIIRITRIRKDSVYLDNTGYLFHQIDTIWWSAPSQGPHNSFNYIRSDSASWKIFFPPDSIYWSKYSLSNYMKSMSRLRRKDKFEWLAPSFRNNIIKLNVGRLANLEIAFSYEARFTKKWSYEIETGYQFSAANKLVIDQPLGIYPLYKYDGFSIITGPKYYFDSRDYIQPLVHYRYLIMDSTMSKFPGGQYRLQDEFRNDLGISIRFGQLRRLGNAMIIDGYIGLGIKAVMVRQIAYGYYYSAGETDLYFRWYNDQHTPRLNNYLQWWPIISFGIKLGIGF